METALRWLPARRWRLARCCAAVASCPVLRGGAAVASCLVLRGGGFLPDAARRWLLARCCAAVASCPMQRGGGFLPDAARRWFLARWERRWRLSRCSAAVASCLWLWYHLLSNVLRTDSECWGVSKFQKCRARCAESRMNVQKCSDLAWIVEEVLLFGHF